MKITRTSPLTQKTETRDLDISESQWIDYESGELIQKCFPYLSPSDREFIKTGYTESDWKRMFPTDELEFDEIDQKFYPKDEEV